MDDAQYRQVESTPALSPVTQTVRLNSPLFFKGDFGYIDTSNSNGIRRFDSSALSGEESDAKGK